MPLYLLKWINEAGIGYDMTQGFVVRASNAGAARRIAASSEDHGFEDKAFWLDAKRSSCRRIADDGPSEVILRDYNAG